MPSDTLFLLKPDFADPAFPGQRFFCWHCVLLEGLLVHYPGPLASLTIVRLDWERPRRGLVDRFGAAHQDLPLLALADETAYDGLSIRVNGSRLIAGKDAILDALAALYGIARPHP